MLKKPMVALAFASAMVATGTVNASSVDSSSYAQEFNVGTAFKQTGQPQQIATLSAQEMQDTQGAFLPLLIYAPQLTAIGIGIAHSSAYMPVYHFGHWVNSFRN